MKSKVQNKQINQLIRKTTIPNFTSELSLSATSIVDGMIVSSFYGAKGLAAVGAGAPILPVFTIFAGILGTGNSVVCSNMIGNSSREDTRRAYSLAVLWSLILSVILTAVCIGASDGIAVLFTGATEQDLLPDVAAYIRGFSIGAGFIIFRQLLIPMVNMEGGNRYIHISAVLILISDGVFDYIASAVFDAGTFGLGLASSLSYLVGCLVLLVFYLRKKGFLTPSLGLLRKKGYGMKTSWILFVSGFPAAVKRFCNVVAPVLTNRYILVIATVDSLAVLSAQTSATRFLMCLVLALSTSSLVLFGSIHGESDRVEMEQAAKGMLIHSLAWSIGISLIFILFAEPISLLFVREEATMISKTVYAIRWFAVGGPFMAINHCLAAYLQATKRPGYSNLIILLDRLIFKVILVYLLGWLMGENGVFMSYGISEAALTLVLYIVLCVKCKKPVTSVRQILFLPEDYGVPEEQCLTGLFHRSSDVVGFSRNVEEFCRCQGIDRRRSYLAALCTEELAENVISHGFRKDKNTLSIRLFVEKDGTLTIRFRDNGRTFDLTRFHQMIEENVNDPAENIGIRIVFGLAKEVRYFTTFGMNNTMIRL